MEVIPREDTPRVWKNINLSNFPPSHPEFLNGNQVSESWELVLLKAKIFRVFAVNATELKHAKVTGVGQPRKSHDFVKYLFFYGAVNPQLENVFTSTIFLILWFSTLFMIILYDPIFPPSFFHKTLGILHCGTSLHTNTKSKLFSKPNFMQESFRTSGKKDHS